MENLIQVLADNSISKTHELITEFLDCYGLTGLKEATREQLQEFIQKKGL